MTKLQIVNIQLLSGDFLLNHGTILFQDCRHDIRLHGFSSSYDHDRVASRFYDQVLFYCKSHIDCFALQGFYLLRRCLTRSDDGNDNFFLRWFLVLWRDVLDLVYSDKQYNYGCRHTVLCHRSFYKVRHAVFDGASYVDLQ